MNLRTTNHTLRQEVSEPKQWCLLRPRALTAAIFKFLKYFKFEAVRPLLFKINAFLCSKSKPKNKRNQHLVIAKCGKVKHDL